MRISKQQSISFVTILFISITGFLAFSPNETNFKDMSNILMDSKNPFTPLPGYEIEDNQTLNASSSHFGIYPENELNSYTWDRVIRLLNNTVDPDQEQQHYIVDMEFDSSGNLFVLMGLNLSAADPSDLSEILINGAKNTSNRELVGLVLKLDSNFNPLIGTLIESGDPLDTNIDNVYCSLEISESDDIFVLGNECNQYLGEVPFNMNVTIQKFTSDLISIANQTIGGDGNDEIGNRFAQIGFPSTFDNFHLNRRICSEDLMIMDSEGKLIFTGMSDDGTNFPLQGTYSESYNGSRDIFICKINQDLTLNWSTFYGTSANDYIGAIDIDSQDRIYIGGGTEGNLTLGISYPGQNTTRTGKEGFIAAFNSNGSLHTATYLGGGGGAWGEDQVFSLTLDENDDVWVGGHTDSTDFPLTGGGTFNATQVSNSDGLSSFLTHIDTNDWTLDYSTRHISEANRSTITNLAVVDSVLYFAGVFGNYWEVTFENYNPDLPLVGPHCTNQTTYNSTSTNTKENRMGFIGVMNSSKEMVYCSLIERKNITGHYLSANNRPVLLLNESDDNIYIGLEGNAQGLHLKTFSIVDSDNDGLSDFNEISKYGSSPYMNNSDTDNLTDYEEVYTYSTNPSDEDTDNDCVDDDVELSLGLNPNFADANLDLDGDGLSTYTEIIAGTDPNDPDPDNDNLNDYWEIKVYLTNPYSNDTDNDGLDDGQEVDLEFDPLDADMDDDGLNDSIEYYTNYTYTINGTEYTNKTDPFDSDTDNDLIKDGLEITLGSSPVLNDSDFDLLDDYFEYSVYLTNLTNNDTDSDNITDFQEVTVYMTNASLNDSDFDGLDDYSEIFIYFTNPLLLDSDGDGLNDSEEISLGTPPTIGDSDNDGLSDSIEVNFGSHYNKSDSDGDLLPDWWEYLYSLSPTLNEYSLDLDSDNINTYFEFLNGTHPLLNDTDNDNLLDGDEINIHDTNPLMNDTDKDGLLDGEEIQLYQTNPLFNDTDMDALSDYYEILWGYNPNNPDCDNDNIMDGPEIWIYFTNPLSNDSDNDMLFEHEEINIWFTNPASNDTDNDNISDYDEIYVYFTDPNKNDTDGDLLYDNQELFQFFTNPTNIDSDSDSLTDFIEIYITLTNPLLNDTDSDGVSDGDEIFVYDSNPSLLDSDGDGMPDLWEIIFELDHLSDDSNEDLDGDGLTNLEEFSYLTFPDNADSDGDGVSDYDEITEGTDPLEPDASIFKKTQAYFSEYPGFSYGALASTIGVVGFALLFLIKTKTGLGGSA